MIRILTSVFLSLALGLASVGIGMARVEGGLSRQVTICKGLDVAVITLDSKGNPIAPHHCPACLIFVALAMPPLTGTGAMAPARFQALVPLAQQAKPGLNRPEPCAQGPPFFV